MNRLTVLICVSALLCVMHTQAQVDVSTGGPVTTYANLKLAFDAINAGTHTGAITINITGIGTYTDPAAPAVLNSSGAGAASHSSILIRPTADGVTIGATTGQGRGVIEFNGADNVTIDGDNPNTTGINRNLTIQNLEAPTTTYASVIRVATTNATPYETANDITIKNLILNGNVTNGNASGITSSASSSNASFGIIVGPNGGDGISAITSVTGAMTASSPQPTVNSLLIDNNVVNQCGRGIAFLGSNASSSTGVSISNNIIGTSAVLSGAPPYTTPATTVYVKGIYIAGTNAVAITGNTVQCIISYIVFLSTGVELNTGIGNGSITISGNAITGVVGNAGSAQASGIAVASAAGPYVVSNNTVSNIQTVGNSSTQGIFLTASTAPSATVQLNKVSTVYVRGASGSGIATGIGLSGGSAITVQNNFVSDVNAYLANAFTDLNTQAGAHGIRIQNGANHRIYHNSVSLAGPVVGSGSGSGLASALTITAGITGIDVRNNVFANALTGANDTTAVTCVYLASGQTSLMNLTLNNNAYYQGSALGSAIAQVGFTVHSGIYQAADFNAGATTPTNNFRNYTSSLSPVGSNDNASFATTVTPPFASLTDLHIPAGTSSSLESAGALFGVTTDIDGNVRPGPAGSIHGGAFAPDLGADEFDGVPSDHTAPGIVYSTLKQSASTGNRSFTGVQIVDPSGINTTLGTRPRVYYKRFQDSNDLNDNTNATNGWKYAQSSGTTSPFSFTIDYSLLSGGTGVSLGDTVQYFVVAQDIAPTPNVAILSATLAAPPTSVALTAAAFPATGTINQYKIVQSLNGLVTVGASGTYASLTDTVGLFADINAKALSGDLTVSITSDLIETGVVALNKWAEDGVGNYTLRIVPDAAVVRTIEGTAVHDSVPMINLNGAKRVVFDGRFNGSGQWLLFRATNTGIYGGCTIQFSNGATDDTIRYCRLENNTKNGSFGTILVASASVSDLSTNISIDHSELRNPTGGAPGFPRFPIVSRNGLNSGISVTNNNIFNWLGTAVSLIAGGNCTISNNNFYMVTTDSVISPVIFLQMTGGGHVISGNSIGGAAPDRSGTPLKYGSTSSGFIVVYLSLGSSAPSSIQGNVIGNVIADVGSGFSSPFIGMSLPPGSFPNVNIGTVTGNIIGGAVVTGNARDTIGLPSGSGFAGISCTNTGGTVNIENNVISNIVASPATGTMQAIIASGSYPKSIRNNVIREITANCVGSGTPSTFSTPCGILVGGGSSLSDVVSIEGNKIFNITNASSVGSANLVGLFISSSRGVTAQRNNIYNLHATGAGSPLVWGVYVKGTLSGTMTFSNNMIALGSSSNDVAYIGIEDAVAHGSASSNYYFNSISVSGSATGSNNTYAFNRSGFTNLTFKDNIASNSRSGGTGNHIAIANTYASATGWAASSANYNDLHASSSGTIGQWLTAGVPLTFAGWNASSGGDAQSVSGPVPFVSSTDLHVNASDTIVANKGIWIAGITTDYDNDIRTTTPDIGADEFGLTGVAINVAIASGWNMISNPVTNPVPDDSAKHLFPTIIGRVFEFAGTYQVRDTMGNGRGYWGKFPAATTNAIIGLPRTHDSINVATGWNMVGTISNPVDTSTIVQVPPGLKASAWFGFGSGYLPSSQLIPGKAYWVKANFAGKFVVGSVLRAAKTKTTEKVEDALSFLTITDNKGGSQTLYFGVDADGKIPVSLYVMPPSPPLGAFDARFETPEGGSMVQTCNRQNVREFTIAIQADAYPLTVTWKIKDAEYVMTTGMSARTIHGEGSMKIVDNNLQKIGLKLTDMDELPTEFSLSQNYPNPFNPTTSIKYALPVASRVNMEVYNVLGQRVRALVSENLAAGYHAVEWNGIGNEGQQLASGVYFVQMLAKGDNGQSFHEIRKMMLLK